MAAAVHWVDRIAQQVERFAASRKGAGGKIVCASGITPSGVIHLGNLRELMTVHLVATELKRRGHDCEHIHSWDDFDRFRKVPAGLPESYAEHIGRPVCDVPDHLGEYPSYADRHIDVFEKTMARLGIVPNYIRQSKAYREGRYNELVKLAMSRRELAFQILRGYQTLERLEADEEAARKESYYPYKPYCDSCGRDMTEITSYDVESAAGRYRCTACGHEADFRIDGKINGKLVWKVDWPMRWFYYGVDFEPGGEDHAAPQSSYAAGKQIVKKVFGGEPPYFEGYAFVGMAGRSKISSSAGTGFATPSAALDILEPPLIRWLYLRRNINQSFNIDFGQEVLRVYDEWDTLSKRVEAGTASETDKVVYDRSITSGDTKVTRSQMRVPFRMLASATDITDGHVDSILRIASIETGSTEQPDRMRELIEPRLSCAMRWATQYVPEDERTRVQEQFDVEEYQQLEDVHRRGVAMFVEQLDQHWGFEPLTSWVYGVPKLLAGLELTAQPTDELKLLQRAFFRSLYRLLIKKDTGPRLPTLLMALGQDRVRKLLTPPPDVAHRADNAA